ncbi:CaiF/GrlA family transcriptional regulator [Enterobacteriaceae bacterium H20N1]|uniref:CaiF/GrlA family transcriptional regulator n=1 Tax=Dryocola boscaweniae TaxID=2925397 RepID=A0A9X3AB63_9ENTR|nr:CaiF/GrlA family transcriptional regulator [Dryocola boscaweniae]MCT4700533.1 CaiF/GrlA family transcriptional regulator [Dryocola boscaweniae]MCT4717689.1 CaiF/GrlA family transcriptional regulator [Dryocola boscaweniae]
MQTEKKVQGGLRVIDARQSNHCSYILPRELWAYEEHALYRYVALWSLICKKYICCDDVAANFGISVRQATNIISMIHRRYGDVIQCEIKRVKSEKGNLTKTHILVTHILSETRRKKENDKIESVNENDRAALINMRDFFLYKRMHS